MSSILAGGPAGDPSLLDPSLFPLLPPVPALDDTFGVILIGNFLGLLLYGLTVHQTYRYFYIYREDILLLKAVVLILFIMDTLYSITNIHVCYHYLVLSYFNPLALLNGVWSIRLMTPTTTVVILLSQAFYARRVYIIRPRFHVYVITFVAMSMTCEAGFAVATTAFTWIQPTFAGWEKYTWLTSAAFAFVLATDFVLTTTLILYLTRSRTGFRSTDSMLNILMLYTINTGLMTGVLSLLSLVFALRAQHNLIYVAFNMVTTRSYVISVMAVLNSRKSASQSLRTTEELGTFGMSSVMPPRRTPVTAPWPGCTAESQGQVIDIGLDAGSSRARELSGDVTSAGTWESRENVFEMKAVTVDSEPTTTASDSEDVKVGTEVC